MALPFDHHDPDEHEAHVPAWVDTVGVPIWVTDRDGFIEYMNARAEMLFGHTLEEWRGCACQLVIACRNGDCGICGHHCLLPRFSHRPREIEPVRMVLGNGNGREEASVIVITVDGPVGRQLVHCVIEDEKERRMQRFIGGVMHRSADQRSDVASRCMDLTPREREVLSLLSVDATLYEIAAHLSVSYVTVRNHVQHILRKLGVHSMLEAVAVWVMEEGSHPDPMPPPDGF